MHLKSLAFSPSLLLLTLGLLWVAGASTRALGSQNGTLQERLDHYLQRLAQDGFHGVVLIARGDTVLLHQGYGLLDPATDTPMPRDAVFTLGSIAKPFTATAILRLEQEGVLRTSDPLHRYLDGVPADKRGITLHHLLTHSAGFPGALGNDFEAIDRDAYVARALGTPLGSKPGARYDYSNVGYSLLAAVIERVTDLPYPEALHRLVLEPAGLAETGFDPDLWPAERLAQGWRDGEPWGTVVGRWGTEGPSWHLLGNGGLHSTATDMLRWHRALGDDRLLSPATRAKAWTPHIAENAGETSHYGYGWALDSTGAGPLVAHNGGNGVFFADFHHYPDDDLLVFLASSHPVAGLPRLAETLGRMVRGAAAPNLDGHRSRLLIGAPEPAGAPEARQWAETSVGQGTQRFVAALATRGVAERRRLTEGLFSQRLLDQAGADGLHQFVDQLGSDLGRFTVESADHWVDLDGRAERAEVVLVPQSRGVGVEPEQLLLLLHFEAIEPHGEVLEARSGALESHDEDLGTQGQALDTHRISGIEVEEIVPGAR